VANKAGYAEQYKDVIHEDAIKISEGYALAQVKPTILCKLPIRTINFSNPCRGRLMRQTSRLSSWFMSWMD